MPELEPQPQPQIKSEKDSPQTTPSRAGTGKAETAQTISTATADAAVAANITTATSKTASVGNATTTTAYTQAATTAAANAVEITSGPAISATSSSGSSSEGVEVATEPLDDSNREKTTIPAIEESKKGERTQAQQNKTQPQTSSGTLSQEVSQPTPGAAATEAAAATPEREDDHAPTEQGDTGRLEGKCEAESVKTQNRSPRGEGNPSNADDPETQSSESPYEMQCDLVFRAIRAGVVRRQMVVKGKFAQYRRFHHQYVGSDHNHRRARVIVQRGLKEVYRIRKRVAKQ